MSCEKSIENVQADVALGPSSLLLFGIERGDFNFLKTISTFKVFQAEGGEGDAGEGQEVESR